MHSRPIVLNGLSNGIVRLFESFVPRRSLNECTVNGRDQQSIVIRQRVTHAIQSPQVANGFSRKTFRSMKIFRWTQYVSVSWRKSVKFVKKLTIGDSV